MNIGFEVVGGRDEEQDQEESAPVQEPMRQRQRRQGEVRRKPTTDEKKAKRRLRRHEGSKTAEKVLLYPIDKDDGFGTIAPISLIADFLGEDVAWQVPHKAEIRQVDGRSYYVLRGLSEQHVDRMAEGHPDFEVRTAKLAVELDPDHEWISELDDDEREHLMEDMDLNPGAYGDNARRPESRLVYSGTSNWDTDEVDRWVGNDETLYSLTNGVSDPGDMRRIVEEFASADPHFDVDFDEVDWEEVVTMRKTESRRPQARRAVHASYASNLDEVMAGSEAKIASGHRRHAYSYPEEVGDPHTLRDRVNQSNVEPFPHPSGYNHNPPEEPVSEMSEGAYASREAKLLEALRVAASSEERQRVLDSLEALQTARRTKVARDREVDLAAAVIRDRLTPVFPHEPATASAEWLDHVGIPEHDRSGIARDMAAQASMWVRALIPEVVADREEFAEQAQGKARQVTSSFGEERQAAIQAFLDAAARLRIKSLEAIEAEAAKTAQDEPTEPEPEDYVIYDSGQLGAATSVSIVEGPFLGEFASEEEAEAAIKMDMQAKQFFPNVWKMSDHGNFVLRILSGRRRMAQDERRQASSRKTARWLRRLVMPYSEVNIHMGIAGKEMDGELLPGGRMVQLYEVGSDEPFSIPITRSEAGWDQQIIPGPEQRTEGRRKQAALTAGETCPNCEKGSLKPEESFGVGYLMCDYCWATFSYDGTQTGAHGVPFDASRKQASEPAVDLLNEAVEEVESRLNDEGRAYDLNPRHPVDIIIEVAELYGIDRDSLEAAWDEWENHGTVLGSRKIAGVTVEEVFPSGALLLSAFVNDGSGEWLYSKQFFDYTEAEARELFLSEIADQGWTITSARRTAEDSKTCTECGDPIRKDPDGDGGYIHDSGTKHDHKAKAASRRTAAPTPTSSRIKVGEVSLTNVGIDPATGNGVGTDPSGKRVQFHLSDEDRQNLKDVLYSDLAVNFSGVTVDESDVVSEGSKRKRKQAAVIFDADETAKAHNCAVPDCENEVDYVVYGVDVIAKFVCSDHIGDIGTRAVKGDSKHVGERKTAEIVWDNSTFIGGMVRGDHAHCAICGNHLSKGTEAWVQPYSDDPNIEIGREDDVICRWCGKDIQTDPEAVYERWRGRTSGKERNVETALSHAIRATAAPSRINEDEMCEFVFDGRDTDGTEWYWCVVHDELAPSDEAPCAGYIEAPYEGSRQTSGKEQLMETALTNEILRRQAQPSDDLEDVDIEDFEGGEQGPDPDNQSGYAESGEDEVDPTADNAGNRSFGDEGWAHRGGARKEATSEWFEEGFARGTALAELGVSIEDAPAPLSGEYAGESIPEVFGSWDAATEEAMEDYERGYYEALESVERNASRHQPHQSALRWERFADDLYGTERGDYHLTAVKDRKQWRWIVGTGERKVVTAGHAPTLDDAKIAALGWVIQRTGGEHEADPSTEEGTAVEVWEDEGGGERAADVADVPTPGQEIADYPQPDGVEPHQPYENYPDDWPLEAKRNPALAAFRRRVQANIKAGNKLGSMWSPGVPVTVGGKLATVVSDHGGAQVTVEYEDGTTKEVDRSQVRFDPSR